MIPLAGLNLYAHFSVGTACTERTHEHKHQGIVPTSSDPPSHDAEMLLFGIAER